MINPDSLVKHLDNLQNRINGRPASPAFAERYNVTSVLLLNRTPPPLRTVAAPVYVTDLGVRLTTDPTTFYFAHTAIADVPPIPSADIRNHLITSELNLLADQLDAALLFFGDYECAHQAITRRKDDIIHSNDYRLLIYSGVIAGALGSSGALEFFDAATTCAESKTDSYAAQHRAATFEIKRRSHPEAGLRRLAQAKECTSKRGPRRASRYRSQIAINAAQLRVFSMNSSEASRLLRRNLDVARQNAFDYLPEALGEYAYSLYLDDNYDAASRYATEAFWRYQQIGSARGIRTSREIVTACLYKQRSFRNAEHIAELCENDPLGTRGFDNLV